MRSLSEKDDSEKHHDFFVETWKELLHANLVAIKQDPLKMDELVEMARAAADRAYPQAKKDPPSGQAT